MKLKSLLTLSVAATSLIAASAFAKSEPVNIRIQAQQPGSSFYSYATTMTRLLNETLPEGSNVQIIPRGGSTSNPTILNAGRADIAFALSYTAKLAYDGDTAVYGDRGAHENIMGITGGMHNSYTLVMARKGYIESTGYTTLEEMMNSKDNKPVLGMKPQGSVAIPIANTILKSVGSSVEQLRAERKLVQAQPSQLGELMRDNRIDIYIDNVPVNHAGVTEVSLTNELVFIPIPTDAIETLKSQGMFSAELESDTYRGMSNNYVTTATGMVIMANKKVPDDVIYNFTKTLIEGRDELINENAALKHWNPQTGKDIEFSGVPLHPGAQKYYDSLGW
ncbi:TAXI family TRAP transporter solute-binding subunit [Thaumasiovibrio sp. DFM-14]|uniref:TAXI family TRAP transporter solute-binding subunit n=1 Tax=Thaumasiovibrio sp. DFM-14 TaxID=3384792 RepID=UPI00399FECDF